MKILSILWCVVIGHRGASAFSSPTVRSGRRSISLKSSANGDGSSTSSSPLQEVDVLYGSQRSLIYDPVQERYVNRKSLVSSSELRQEADADDSMYHRFRRQLAVMFFPSGVTPNYFSFVRWRVFQRFINANLHVFGTQSLLLGLGIKSQAAHLGALSAALRWVLKDALGKIVRLFWASQMGRRFDSDAKRWRYRSAFLFAAGNGLEILSFVIPSLFLYWATLANCFKQISMLTSSSTRTAIYNSFRDGSRENIGDITAKGEAQIAIVDLLGIVSGVTLSRTLGASVKPVLMAFGILQVAEIYCVYRQLRSVTYRVVNFERLVALLQGFAERGMDTTELLPTPEELAKHERIFLPPKHLWRRTIAFGSLGRARLSPDELDRLVDIFRKDRFLLVVGPNVKNSHRRWLRFADRDTQCQENCHVVLHTDATNLDIVKSTLALIFLRRRLAQQTTADPRAMRTSDHYDDIAVSLQQAEENLPQLIQEFKKCGWESPARLMFGRVRMRLEWPLPPKTTSSSTSTTT